MQQCNMQQCNMQQCNMQQCNMQHWLASDPNVLFDFIFYNQIEPINHLSEADDSFYRIRLAV